MPERTIADPAKLLENWMEWENGETPPGRVLSNLKIAGMRDVLEALIEAQRDAATTGSSGDEAPEA